MTDKHSETAAPSSNQCHCRACVGDHLGHGPCTLPGPSAIPCWSADPPTWHRVALKNDCAHCEIERLRGLLSKWVTYCDLSGAKPVSADVRDNPVLQLLKDSREALPDRSNAHETTAVQNLHSDEWWQAELDRCVGIEQAKYRALFNTYAELKAGDPDITAGVRPAEEPSGSSSTNLFGTSGTCTCGFADVPPELPCQVHGPDELSRELSPSEAASFGKTLARSPRRVPLRDSDAAFNLGVLPTEQPEKATAVPTQKWIDHSQGLTGLKYDEHGERLPENGTALTSNKTDR